MLDGTFEDPMLRELTAELAAPFAVQQVSWRVGSTNRKKWESAPADNKPPKRGQALAYLDSRDVMDRFDQVCGVAGWQADYVDAGNGETCCRIGVKLDGEWVWKANGAGKTAMEGDKGAFSDAFKRAAVLWGVGRYLYAVSAPWVSLDDYWHIHQDEYKKLDAHLQNYTPRDVGVQTPGEINLLSVLSASLRTFCAKPEDVDTFIEQNKGMLAKLTNGQKQIITDQMKALGWAPQQKETA